VATPFGHCRAAAASARHLASTESPVTTVAAALDEARHQDEARAALAS
jgi:hypothetical protein